MLMRMISFQSKIFHLKQLLNETEENLRIVF